MPYTISLIYPSIKFSSFKRKKTKQLTGHEGKLTILTTSVCEHSISGLIFMSTSSSTWRKTQSARASYSVSFWASKPYFCNHFSEVKYLSVICFGNGWSPLFANKENKQKTSPVKHGSFWISCFQKQTDTGIKISKLVLLALTALEWIDTSGWFLIAYTLAERLFSYLIW